MIGILNQTFTTVPAPIERRRSIKIWEFQVVLYLKFFEICGVLIKFLHKKWTFVAKKWCFLQICPNWCSNQEQRSIGADTVFYLCLYTKYIRYPKAIMKMELHFSGLQRWLQK